MIKIYFKKKTIKSAISEETSLISLSLSLSLYIYIYIHIERERERERERDIFFRQGGRSSQTGITTSSRSWGPTPSLRYKISVFSDPDPGKS